MFRLITTAVPEPSTGILLGLAAALLGLAGGFQAALMIPIIACALVRPDRPGGRTTRFQRCFGKLWETRNPTLLTEIVRAVAMAPIA